MTGVKVAVVLLGLLASGGMSQGIEAAEAPRAAASLPLQAILRASDTQAGDSFGFAVGVSGDTAVVGAYSEDGGPGDPESSAGAAYVFQQDSAGGPAWRQVARLQASDAQFQDSFAEAVSISGDTIAIGARGEDGGTGDPVSGAGAVYVFERDHGGKDKWGQIQKILAPDAEADAGFGRSVALDGDTMVVGASGEDGEPGDPCADCGAAYVFQYVSGHDWLHAATLRASDGQANDIFGHSVAISGGTVVVGAYGEDGVGDAVNLAGAVYVFQRDEGGPGNWGEVEKLTASDLQDTDRFGYSVAVAGDVLLVGAFGEDGGLGDPIPGAGAVYIFEDLSTLGWTQIRKIYASDVAVADSFGYSVALSNDTAIIGAIREDGGAGDPVDGAGAAYVFIRHYGGTNAWGEVARLAAPDPGLNDNFGYVAISGRNIIVGAESEDGGPGDPLANAGAAYAFNLSLLKAFKAN
jgi:hypothetical protein